MDQEKENNNEIDLSKSFDEGGKSQGEKQSPEYFFYPGTPKIIQWLIKYSGGLIKNENQAGYFLIVLIGLFLIITIILFSKAIGGPSEPPPGFRGNIPSSPEYQNPPWPENFR